MKLLATAVKEKSPEGVVPDPDFPGSFKTEKLKGKWFRVIPSTARDVFYLQSLIHRIDKLAPARGGGLLVREGAMPG
jgi:hypothetical protein